MSYFLKKDDKDGTKDTYQKALIYQYFMSEAEGNYKNYLNFHNTEKYLYGRVSRKYIPIEIDTDNMLMAPISVGVTSAGSEASSIMAAAFVSKAFEDLRSAFAKKSMQAGFDKNSRHISDLVAAQAHVNPQKLYSDHLTAVQNSIMASYRKNNITIANFGDFLRRITPTIKKIAKTMPFTYTGFIKSKYCDPRVSGLVIDLAQGVDFNDDQYKISNFRDSPNWNFYLNACRSYGFSVDSANPWRLVADIGSPVMVDYAQQTFGCGFNTTDEILSFGYRPAHITFYENFMIYLLRMYNTLKVKYEYPEHCADGTLRSRVVDPPEYTLSEIAGRYLGTKKLLDLYMDIRLIEDENSYSRKKYVGIKTRTQSIARTKGTAAALNAFEAFIGQTYKYSGSLTDKFNRVKMVEQMEDDEIMSGKLDTHGGPSGGGY